jgi:hypothetical protein
MLDYQQAGALLAKVKAAEAAVASSRLQMQDLCEKLRTVETVRDFLKQRLEDAEAEAAAAHASRDAAHAQSLINAETLTFLDEKMQDSQRAAEATAAALAAAQRRAAEAEAQVAAERAGAEELRSQMEAARAHAAALQAQVQALQAQRSAEADGGSGGSRDRSASSSGGSGHGSSPLDAAALGAATSLSVTSGGGGGAAAGLSPSPPGPPPFSPAERAALLRQLRVLEGAVKASRDRIRELTGGASTAADAAATGSSSSSIGCPATPTDTSGSVAASDADGAAGKLPSASIASAEGSGRRGSIPGRGSLCATSAAAILAAAAAGGGLLAPFSSAGDAPLTAQPPLPPPASPLPPLPPKAHNGFAAEGSGDGAAASCATEVAALSRAELLELVRRMEAAQEAEAANWRAQKRTLVAAVRKLRGEEAHASPAVTEAATVTASSS